MCGGGAAERGVGAMLRQQEAAATSTHWQLLQLAPTPTQGTVNVHIYTVYSTQAGIINYHLSLCATRKEGGLRQASSVGKGREQSEHVDVLMMMCLHGA